MTNTDRARFDFLRLRYARAIELGDDATATRLRAILERMARDG